MRRTSLLALLTPLLLATTCEIPPTPPTGCYPGGPPLACLPNVVVILADDLGYADVGYHGSPIQTPNIDELAADGIVLGRFYAHPWCTTSRASLLTGRVGQNYPWDIGPDRRPGGGIPGDEYTIAERFRDAGYQTALIGKWHQGTLPEHHPNEHGFDYFFGALGGWIDYWTHDTPAGGPDWQRNGVEVSEAGYVTEILGIEAADWIAARDVNRPFFLELAFTAPHFLAQAPPEDVDRYAAFCGPTLVEITRCYYMAQVDVMDREIGRVLDALEAAGIDGNTIVVFSSDNGGTSQVGNGYFAAGGGLNAPLRGEKGEILEGGVRVPAVVSWPVVLAPGQSDQVVHIADWFATLESAAGLERAAPTESRDLWDSLRSGTIEPHPPIELWTYDRQNAGVIDNDYKLVWRDGGAAWEVYHLPDDPGESMPVMAGP